MAVAAKRLDKQTCDWKVELAGQICVEKSEEVALVCVTTTEVPLSKAFNSTCSVTSKSDCGCTWQLPGVNVIRVFLEKRALL